jgi:predicted DNA-binding transcriptional regulator AlpA
MSQKRIRASSENPLRLYRPGRLARLFDVHMTTIWRWQQNGTLPPPVEISPGIRGWPEGQIRELMEKRQAVAHAQ